MERRLVRCGSLIAVAVALLLPATAPAEPPAAVKKALASITSKELKDDVAFLSSDALEGRYTGSAGEAKAVDHIVKAFERLKLKPFNKEGTYRQTVPIAKEKGANVIALLEGSDEKLKDEYVLIGAHHDHLGKAPGTGHAGDGDTIFNGADDNASGVSAVLEIAEAIVESGIKPKRSILFVTFTAEELRLLGSKHYVENPPVPLKQHAAMLNLDMIGRNPEKPVRVSGIGTCPKWEKIVREASKSTKVVCELAPGYTGYLDGNTDHEPFVGVGIPIICFFSGYHDDYHKSTDHADKLDYKRMEQIARMVLSIVMEIADMPEKPEFTLPKSEPHKHK